ncbi:tetratricopeptide repeat protein [Mucisphaera calidilacus]|uniref:Outer membrane protein assembly factor BamD n=1 Tax=Mucisphaera calidilacus TaxID=2527982 RepID=A0A518BZ13_9BACT|nr:tetratricopeptide repeat protein [Mucisphaera calidilacus]QDU72194.1 Outer membrane protein assembly factor BamD [Mucisphaera calidilacus]
MPESDETTPETTPDETLEAEASEAGDVDEAFDEDEDFNESEPSSDAGGWGQVWQLPALLVGMGMLAMGVFLALPAEVEHDFAGALDSTRKFLIAENLEEARTTINQVLEQAHVATPEQRALLERYRGDLQYQSLRQVAAVPVDTEARQQTLRRIVAHYRESEQLGLPLDTATKRRLAMTYGDLGRETDAMATIDRMADAPAQQRLDLVRHLIERRLRDPQQRREDAMIDLIDRYRDEVRQELNPDVRRAGEIWGTATEAELLLETGDADAAVDYLLRHYQRLFAAGGDKDLAPIIVKLARGYQSKDPPEFDHAERYYRFAQQRLHPSDALNAEILMRLGQIALVDGDEESLQTAMATFNTVIREFPSEPVFADALIGKGDVDARMGAYPESLESLSRAVAWLIEHARAGDPRRDHLTDVVRTHVDYLADTGDFDRVLDYLMILLPLFGNDLPAPVLLDLAVTHEKIAGQQREFAGTLDPYARNGENGPTPEAVRMANQKAARHFADAAANYLAHARSVTILDNEAHGKSLWQAGVCYDNAQLWDEAVSVYAEYVETRQEDARRHRAMARLGKSLMASGEFQAAIDQFLILAQQQPTGFETFGVLVPLARAYVAVGDNDAALRTLQNVLEDHEAIRPDSDQYREALIELGVLYYRLGEQDPRHYVQAIQRLKAAVERYGDRLEAARLRFLLADAYRKSTAALEETDGPTTQRARVAAFAERNDRLEKAQALYNMVIVDLESRIDQVLSPDERLYLRNAYFYQADCAFGRRDFESAIALYGEAARRWEHHPAALVALVQIFNARCELGQYQEARVANDQARWQLERMPDDAFDDPTLPMSREHWEDWLRWTSELELLDTQASVGS